MPGPTDLPIARGGGATPGTRNARSSNVRTPGKGSDNNWCSPKLWPRVALVVLVNNSASDSPAAAGGVVDGVVTGGVVAGGVVATGGLVGGVETGGVTGGCETGGAVVDTFLSTIGGG